MGIPFDVLQAGKEVTPDVFNRAMSNVAHAFSLIPDPARLNISATTRDFTVTDEIAVVVLEQTPGIVTVFLPAPVTDRQLTILNKSAYVVRSRTRTASQSFADIPAGGLALYESDSSKWYSSGIVGGASSGSGSGGGGTPPAVPGAPANAAYWVSTDAPTLPFSVNMSLLGTGVLQQTVTGAVAVPQAIPLSPDLLVVGSIAGLLAQQALTQNEVTFGGAAGGLTQSPNFYFDAVNQRWGLGTNAPDAGAAVTLSSDFDGFRGLFVRNVNTGTAAHVGALYQTGVGAFGTSPYLAVDMLGPNTPGTGGFAPAGSAVISFLNDFAGSGDLVISSATQGMTGGSTIFKLREHHDEAARFDHGTLDFSLTTLAAGGLVYADPQTYDVLTGVLKLVSIGAGLSFTGGTLSATGGTGTVTGVTGTAPIVVTPASPNPIVSLNYDGVTITLSGAAGTPIQRAALTGVIDAAAGSNATSFAAISARSVLANATGGPASPGAFPAPNSGDVLWRSGAGLVWSAIPVSSVTGAVPDTRNINTTAPLTGGGNLSADRTLAISDFVASGASHARGAVPDPGAVAGTAKFLREDATWAVAPGTGVPTSRTLSATSPILIDGGAGPLDLSANRTFSHAASGVTPGSVVYPTLLVDAGGHITSAVSGTPTATLAWYTEENEYGSNAYLPTSSGFLTVNEATYCTGTLVSLGTLTVNVLSNPLTSGSVVIQLFGRVGGSPIAVASVTINVGDPAGIYTASGATGSASANDRYGLTVNESTAAGVSNFAFSALAFLK